MSFDHKLDRILSRTEDCLLYTSPVPDEAGLTMTAGNAGGTEIAINGKAGAPLGAMGAVLHNYALTPPAAKPATPPAAN